MSTPAAIACRGLTKRYGSVLALDGLDLEVPAGSVFGFLGPNGAGKTTTIRLLASLALASSGTGTVAGLPVGDGEPNRRGLVGLTDASRRSIGGFSGGMRQRLGLAQAILNRPPVLLLDEPVSSLDPEGRVDMLGVIRDLGGESTVLFSTHILTDVERVCDRVAILDRGRLVTTGPMDELLERYAQPVYRLEPEDGQAAGVARLVESLRGAPWVVGVEEAHGAIRVAVIDGRDAGRELLAAVAAGGVALLGFERQRPTLEDVFLQLVGRGARADDRGAA